MRLLILTLLLFTLLISEGTAAHLNRITRAQSSSSTQIYAHFDELPLYRQRVSERRLDLILVDTNFDEFLAFPENDEVIVKTLAVQQLNNTVVSIFFRYIPQDLQVTSEGGTALVIDLIPGNRFTRTFRDLSSNLGRLAQVSADRQTLINPLTFSPYKNDWRSFIESFEHVPELNTEPTLYVPPFPLISLLAPITPPESVAAMDFIEGLKEIDRFESLRLIQKRLKVTNKENVREYFALAHADILYRLGSIEAARNQFKLLAETYHNDITGDLAGYVVALLEARDLKFHVAQAHLQHIFERLSESHPLYSHLRLALAETALAIGEYEQMDQFLQVQDIPFSLTETVKRRRADLAFATGRIDDAFRIYEELLGSGVMTDHPYSLNGYCSTLFKLQANEESGLCYQGLAAILNDQTQASQAAYLGAIADSAVDIGEDYPADRYRFNQIVRRFPNTAAAYAAELKLADSCALDPENCETEVSGWYKRIAGKTTSREVAQEASFKEAIVFHLNGEDRISIDLLRKMLREFQSGILQDQILALLIQLLPGEIRRLLDGDSPLQAIALAQQNRTLFDKGWLDDDLLFRIGQAFEGLRIYPEALQLYLYLKNKPTHQNSEHTHFAALRAAHALGDHHLVEDLAAEYSYRYPQGVHQLDILFYRLDCKYAVGLVEEALNLLPDPIPQRNDFRMLAAALYFQIGLYGKTADVLLSSFDLYSSDLTDDMRYMLAESLYELGEFTKCETLFKTLEESKTYGQTARYRLAQFSDRSSSLENVQLSSGTNFEDGGAQRWNRFAAQDIRFKELLSNL